MHLSWMIIKDNPNMVLYENGIPTAMTDGFKNMVIEYSRDQAWKGFVVFICIQ